MMSAFNPFFVRFSILFRSCLSFLPPFSPRSIIDGNQHDKCRFIFKINIQTFCRHWTFLLMEIFRFVVVCVDDWKHIKYWRMKTTLNFFFESKQKKFHCAHSISDFIFGFGMHFQWSNLSRKNIYKIRCIAIRKWICMRWKILLTQNRSTASARKE